MHKYLKKYFSLNKVFICIAILNAGSSLQGETSFKGETMIKEIDWAGISFKMVQTGESNHKLIWLHGDEKTAKMALEDYVHHNPGIAYFIQYSEREVPFWDTKVDPNRIFSTVGSRKALQKFKTDWNNTQLNEAVSLIERERRSFLDEIFPTNGGLLISLHNNFRGYNVHSEIKNSTSISIKEGQNPRDFIICTEEEDYLKLAKGPYNVVLQDKKVGKDDGSLSWASLENGVRYINIEVRLGWLSKQKKMLNYIHDTLLNENN